MLTAVWVVAVIVGIGMVVYGFGPVFQARQQAKLTRVAKAAISQAANEAGGGLAGATATVSTKAPEPGSPVGILEIGRTRLQQVVVEGAGSTETRKGPGHVAGTAGLGQPGNSVVVGRARGFGGPFGDLARLRKGDQILVSTTQGQSVYSVDSVRGATLHKAATGADAAADPKPGNAIDTVYGPSKEDRLTLVTSASTVPWNHGRAVIVVATLVGRPFAPTPQNGRVDTGLGVDGDTAATASVVLAMLLFGATMSASVVLYRRVRPATAYLLTIGPVMASTVIAGETLSRLFPGWT